MIAICGFSLFSPSDYFFRSLFRMIQMQQSRLSGYETALSFLPTISFVHSLPPRGDWCTELARRSCDWSKSLTLTDGRSLKQVRPTTANGRLVYDLAFCSVWRANSFEQLSFSFSGMITMVFFLEFRLKRKLVGRFVLS